MPYDDRAGPWSGEAFRWQGRKAIPSVEEVGEGYLTTKKKTLEKDERGPFLFTLLDGEAAEAMDHLTVENWPWTMARPSCLPNLTCAIRRS